MRTQRVPDTTLERLPIYVHGLRSLARRGIRLASSHRLCEETAVDAAQIRRDLSYLGAFGTPGLGYDVEGLLEELGGYLGVREALPVALAGCSGLAEALMECPGMNDGDFRLAAVFDGPGMAGRRVGTHQVLPFSAIPSRLAGTEICTAILASAPELAQDLGILLERSGVTSILNLTTAPIRLRGRASVRNVNLGAELQILSHLRKVNARSETPNPVAAEETTQAAAAGRLR